MVTLNPPMLQFLEAGTTWVDPGGTATDTRDGSVPIVRIPNGPNNMLLAVQRVRTVLIISNWNAWLVVDHYNLYAY